MRVHFLLSCFFFYFVSIPVVTFGCFNHRLRMRLFLYSYPFFSRSHFCLWSCPSILILVTKVERPECKKNFPFAFRHRHLKKRRRRRKCTSQLVTLDVSKSKWEKIFGRCRMQLLLISTTRESFLNKNQVFFILYYSLNIYSLFFM